MIKRRWWCGWQEIALFSDTGNVITSPPDGYPRGWFVLLSSSLPTSAGDCVL